MAASFVVWFTGLPCSGKTTLAKALAYQLVQSRDVCWLDGDETRKTFGKDLGFSPEDRNINIERVLGVCAFLVNQGTSVICSYISPYEAKRRKLRDLVEHSIIVWVSTSADVCAERDVKGMWAKAITGEITGFTGYDAPYEKPQDYDVCIDTSLSVDECLKQINLEIQEREL